MRLGLSAYAAPPPVPRMPPGLVELMEGLSRDVLRANPSDIYQFCADHMHKLIILRAAREGRTRTMTLEEKIARAQKIVRQRAERRRRRYDEPDRQSPRLSDEEESLDNDTRAMNLGFSPRIAVSESFRPVSREAYESYEIVGQTESCEHDTGERETQESKYGTSQKNIESFKHDIGENGSFMPYMGEKEAENLHDTVEKEIQEPKHDTSDKEPDSFKHDTGAKGTESLKHDTGEKGIQESKNDSTEKEIESFEDGSDEAKIQESIKNEIVIIQHSTQNEPNVEHNMEETYISNGDEDSSKNVGKSMAIALPFDKVVEPLNTDTAVENKALIQECDELPIETHIIESGEKADEKNNATENSENLIKCTTEFNSDNEATLKFKSDKSRELCNEDANSSNNAAIDKYVLGNLVQDETAKNKIDNQSEDLDDTIFSLQGKADGNNETRSDDNIETIGQGNTLQDKIAETVERKSKVEGFITEFNDEHQSDASIEMRQIKSVETPDDNWETKSDVHVKTEINAEVYGEKHTDPDNNSTNWVMNQNIENSSGDTGNNEPNNSEFASVTIEVKAPTPLLEHENQDELVGKLWNETKINSIECENNSLKDNIETLPDVKISEKNKDESKMDIYESTIVVSIVPSEAIGDNPDSTELHNHSFKEGMVTLNKSILHSNEDHTNSSNDNYADIKQSLKIINDDKNSAPLDTERVSYMSIPGNDIDINALAKSDSTNDLIIEETTESISETNTEADERDESSNNTSAMDLETAAVTIQKVFRTFLFKSKASTLDDASNDEESMDVGVSEDILLDEGGHNPKQEDEFANVKDRRTLGITRMDTVLQTVNEEKSLSLSTDDSSTLSSAATTIQAHVRGFLVRNRLHLNKTNSVSSLVNSDGQSLSQDADNEQQKSKTILNIHIVPEAGHFMSRDESIAMSLDLPLDTSPPSSMSNLHPLSFDVSEKRKLLKREDAIQSVSPPSNNSGKLSEDSGKEVLVTDNLAAITHRTTDDDAKPDDSCQMEKGNADLGSDYTSPTKSVTADTVLEFTEEADESKSNSQIQDEIRPSSVIDPSADETDVITSLVSDEEKVKIEPPRLLHSGEFHDVVLPTCVSRSETAVVREFKNVLGYFLLWNSAS